MIRLIQRRLIIPRGDTGTFSIPNIGFFESNVLDKYGMLVLI